MANDKLKMTNLRMLLKRLDDGESQNSISDALHMSKKTIIKYKNQAKSSGKSYKELLSMSDADLEGILQPSTEPSCLDSEKYRVLQPLIEDYIQRLQRGRYVNIMSLWEEYEKAHHGDACGYYQYTQFKHYLNEYGKSHEYSYISHYVAGREWQIDFAGDTLHITDIKTGEKTPVVLLVCIMPYSSLVFAWAMENARQELLFDGLNRGLTYMGAAPVVAKSDNMKQWMKRYDRYEPDYSEECNRWCLHYGIIPEPCRPRHPRDKGPVESAVNQVYRYIYARIEETVFYSLDELNSRIIELLDEYNSKPVRGNEHSRLDIFNSEEKPLMSDLPDQMYSFRYSKTVKVGPSYHVEVGKERHRYSVPYQYVNQEVKVLWDLNSVEIYAGNKRIATHARNIHSRCTTTLPEHMPDRHRAYEKCKMMNAAAYISHAEKAGPYTAWGMQYILNKYRFPEQGYPTCWGLVGIMKKYGNERTEKACEMLHNAALALNLKCLRNILENNRENAIYSAEASSLPENDNVRGADNYSKIINQQQ